MDHCETSSVIFVISGSWMMKRNRDGVSRIANKRYVI